MPVGQQSATWGGGGGGGGFSLPRLRSTSWPRSLIQLAVPEIVQTGPIRSLSRGQMLTASVARVVVSGNASARYLKGGFTLASVPAGPDA